MEITVHVKGYWSVRNGKRIYHKPYSYVRSVREPRVVNGVSKSIKHILEANSQLRKIAQFSERSFEGYQVMKQQYPEVFKLVESKRPLGKKQISEELRLKIEHVYNTLYT